MPDPNRSADPPRSLNGDEAAGLRLEFASRVEAVRERFRAASDELRGADAALRDEGRPPSYELVLSLGECHREFLRLRNELFGRARSAGIPLSEIEGAASLGDLERWIGLLRGRLLTPPVEPPTPEPAPAPAPTLDAPEASALLPKPEPVADDSAPEPEPEPAAAEPVPEHAGENERRAALSVLDEVLRIRTRDGSTFAPLQECLARAEALRVEIAGSPPENLPEDCRRLAEGGHAFQGLLTLVGGEALSDAGWAAVHTQVAEAFGRPLAVAGARGKLVLSARG